MTSVLQEELTEEEKKALCQAAMDAVEVGAIFYSSWGYDQTNVDYYQVVSRTKASVRVRKIGKRREDRGSGSDRVFPAKDQFLSDKPARLKRLKAWTYGGQITVAFHLTSYADGYLYEDDGKGKYETSVGWGH